MTELEKFAEVRPAILTGYGPAIYVVGWWEETRLLGIQGATYPVGHRPLRYVFSPTRLVAVLYNLYPYSSIDLWYMKAKKKYGG